MSPSKKPPKKTLQKAPQKSLPKLDRKKPYRKNVCAVLVNEAGTRVLVFRRADMLFAKHRWQFPQGGLDAGETPRAGLLRELKEEIGTNDVKLLARTPRPIAYDYPPDVVAQLVADGSKLARFRGQQQHWFLARLRGPTSTIHFEHEPREFDAFRWVTPQQAVTRVVPFKREAYVRGLTALGLLKAVPGKPAIRKKLTAKRGAASQRKSR